MKLVQVFEILNKISKFPKVPLINFRISSLTNIFNQYQCILNNINAYSTSFAHFKPTPMHLEQHQFSYYLVCSFQSNTNAYSAYFMHTTSQNSKTRTNMDKWIEDLNPLHQIKLRIILWRRITYVIFFIGFI